MPEMSQLTYKAWVPANLDIFKDFIPIPFAV